MTTTTLTVLPEWTTSRKFGPLEAVMPLDPDPTPGVDWGSLYFMGVAHAHQDSQDRLNADRTWGTGNPAEYGGSGIGFGYSTDDIGCILVATKALQNTIPGPDQAHGSRRLLYPLAGFSMTHDVYYARRVQQAAAYQEQWFPMTGPVILDDQGWFPTNLDNLLAYAAAYPHQGLKHISLRPLGWTLYAKAAEHLCARTLGSAVSTAYMEKALHILDLAAMLPTGQMLSDFDGAHPTDQPGEILFHWGILAVGALACCKRLHKPVPAWVPLHLDALDTLPQVPYYSGTSFPTCVYTDGAALKASTGLGQGGDPAWAYYSSVCAAAYYVSGDPHYKQRANRWGPTTADTEDNRKISMLLRGMQ